MNRIIALLLAVAVLAVLLLALWFWRRPGVKPGIDARDAASPVTGRSVLLPEDQDDSEERLHRRRSGERQELKRKIVHGPYRPIEDRGARSTVAREPPTEEKTEPSP